MKRYKYIMTAESCIDYENKGVMLGYFKDDSQGEWVKYEDVKGTRNEEYLKGYCKAVKQKDIAMTYRPCNCVDMVNEMNAKTGKIWDDEDVADHFPKQRKAIWICPAHGYKKL